MVYKNVGPQLTRRQYLILPTEGSIAHTLQSHYHKISKMSNIFLFFLFYFTVINCEKYSCMHLIMRIIVICIFFKYFFVLLHPLCNFHSLRNTLKVKMSVNQTHSDHIWVLFGLGWHEFNTCLYRTRECVWRCFQRNNVSVMVHQCVFLDSQFEFAVWAFLSHNTPKKKPLQWMGSIEASWDWVTPCGAVPAQKWLICL